MIIFKLGSNNFYFKLLNPILDQLSNGSTDLTKLMSKKIFCSA
jgi:hypothetical protein